MIRMRKLLVLLCLVSGQTVALRLASDGSCPLAIFLPFTDERAGPPDEINREEKEWYGFGQWSSAEALGKASFSLMAAAQMAKDHFNSRDASVVPELAEYETCNVTLPDTWYFDSTYSRTAVVDQLLRVTQNPENTLCAVIGPTEPRANEGASVITENLLIPQIAYNTLDRRLARQKDFPTFIRAIPAGIDLAKLIPQYLQRDIMKRDFVGVIYEQSDYGEMYEDPLEDAEDDLGYLTITEHVLEEDGDEKDGARESMRSSFGDVLSEGFHTVVFAAERPAVLDDIAAVSDELGIIGDDYFWFFTGDLLPPELFSTLSFKVDSPEDKLLRGAALITNFDPFVYQPEGDPFLQAWRAQNDEMLDLLAALHPLDESAAGYFVGEPGYFQRETPTEYASFLYDAIMSAGMAACRAAENGSSHIDEIFAANFHGASGQTIMQANTNSRDITGIKFGVYNVRPGDIDPNTNTRSYTRHLTAIYDGTEQIWKKVEEFQYYDGTTNEPMPLRDTVNWHYLSSGARVLGFTLVGISLFIIFTGAAWVVIRRKQRVVTAAQPQFLLLICFGGTLMAVSLIFISLDESYGWSTEKLDKACAAFPWFFVMGYVIQYSAIFSKLWRLSKLLSMRRRAVEIKQVLLPFAVIIVSSIVVLIVWQIVDPFHWDRSLLADEFSEEPWESYGECKSSNVKVFVIPLGLLFGVAMLMTLVISWKMRDVQSELSEARWIFIAIFSHMQIWAIGIPLYLNLRQVSRDSAYFISAAMTTVVANVFVLFMIWPRMIADIKSTFFADAQAKRSTRVNLQKGTTHISGLDTSVIPSQQNSQVEVRTSGSTPLAYSDDRLKILSLEAEIMDLKATLAKYPVEMNEIEAACTPVAESHVEAD